MDFNKIYESTQKLSEAFAGNFLRYVLGAEQWEVDEFLNGSSYGADWDEDSIVNGSEKDELEAAFNEWKENEGDKDFSIHIEKLTELANLLKSKGVEVIYDPESFEEDEEPCLKVDDKHGDFIEVEFDIDAGRYVCYAIGRTDLGDAKDGATYVLRNRDIEKVASIISKRL